MAQRPRKTMGRPRSNHPPTRITTNILPTPPQIRSNQTRTPPQPHPKNQEKPNRILRTQQHPRPHHQNGDTMNNPHWAKAETNQPTINTNPPTWEPIINYYYTIWSRHVYDTKQTHLLTPSRQHPSNTWKTLGASTQSIHSTLSIAFLLKNYAQHKDGTGIRPTRHTIAHARGYTDNGTDGIDAPLHRLQAYGFIQCYTEHPTINGNIPVYRLTIPKQLPQELPQHWKDPAITGPLKKAISAINRAIADEQRRIQGKNQLRNTP